MSCHLKRDRLNRFFMNVRRQLNELDRKGLMPAEHEYRFDYFDSELAERAIKAKLNLQKLAS